MPVVAVAGPCRRIEEPVAEFSSQREREGNRGSGSQREIESREGNTLGTGEPPAALW